MSFEYIPIFRFQDTGEAKPVQEESKNSQYYLEVHIPSQECLRFLVKERTDFLDNDVDVVHLEVDWMYSHINGVHAFTDDEGRKWTPDIEVGDVMGPAITGMFNGELTGDTAAGIIMELLLQLEVEVHRPWENFWMEKYFPKFFKYYRDRLEKRKLRKVKDVMES